jgi:hypothetical protein
MKIFDYLYGLVDAWLEMEVRQCTCGHSFWVTKCVLVARCPRCRKMLTGYCGANQEESACR